MLFAFVLKILRTILVFDVIGLFFGFQSLLSGFHQVTFFVAIQVFFCSSCWKLLHSFVFSSVIM